ncbi:MAG: hypothetical protein IJX58_07255 [Clostridia bacterium]|nr:hypothetical protein [Clostridia bacterium]
MKRIISLIILICMAFSLVSCNELLGVPENPYTEEGNNQDDVSQNTGNNSNNNGSQNTDTNNGSQNSGNNDMSTTPEKKPITVYKRVMTNLYKTMSEFKVDEPIESYTDGEYNYFYFKLGEVSRVPIAFGKTVLYEGIGNRTLTFKTTSTTQNVLSSTTEHCISTTVSTKLSAGIKGNLGMMDSATGLSASLATYLDSTTSTSLSYSMSKKFTDTISETFTRLEEDVFELDPSCPAGVYRYTVYANVEIYAIVVADIADETFQYTFVPLVKESDSNSAMIEGWIYSEDGYYETNETIYDQMEKLSLDDLISDIDLYGKVEKYINVRRGTLNITKTSTVDEDNQVLILTGYFCNVLNEELLEDFGYTKAVITVNYTVKSPSGACQSKIGVFTGNTLHCKSDWLYVSESGQNYKIQCEIPLNVLKEANYEIILKFDCRSDGILDILKNSYYVESGTLNIEMK